MSDCIRSLSFEFYWLILNIIKRYSTTICKRQGKSVPGYFELIKRSRTNNEADIMKEAEAADKDLESRFLFRRNI